MDFAKRLVKSILRWDEPSPSPWRRKLKDAILCYREWNSMGKQLDPGIRYHPVVSFLKKFRKKVGRELVLLDVGSGDIGLRYFLKKSCVSVDIAMDRKVYRWGGDVDPVRGSILDLPLKDRSVDAVITLDTVDDVEPENRKRALTELIRTARKLVIVGVPYGANSNLFARKMYERELQLGQVPEWRKIDIERGFPEEEFDRLILESLDQHPRASVITKRNENLVLLELRWYLEHLVNPSSFFFRPIMELVTRMTKYLSFGKCYRRIYYLKLGQ